MLASSRCAALGVSPDFKAVIVDPVQLREVTEAVRKAQEAGTGLTDVPGIDPAMAAAVNLEEASPVAVARFCGTMQRFDVAGEIKTACVATTVAAARARLSCGQRIARALDRQPGAWHYDDEGAMFRCTFGDELFESVVPANHRKQLAHAVVVMGCDASMYVVATTSAVLYTVLVTRGTSALDPAEYMAGAGLDEPCTWAEAAHHQHYARRTGRINAYLAQHRQVMQEVVEYMGLDTMFNEVVVQGPTGPQLRVGPVCPDLKATVPQHMRLSFVSHWRLAISVRVTALFHGPLPVCKRFKACVCVIVAVVGVWFNALPH